MKHISASDFIHKFDRDLHLLSYHITLLPRKRLAGSKENVSYCFNYIDADSLINSVAKKLCDHFGMTLLHCRINEYGCSDFCGEHADTAYKNSHTLILNMLPTPDSLHVNGCVVAEELYDITIIEPNELHEVRAGHNRISLVMFARSVNQ